MTDASRTSFEADPLEPAAGDRRPLLVYDGACAFCRRWVRRWQMLTGARVRYAPYQALADPFEGVAHLAFASAVHLRDARGRWTRGAEAALGALADVPALGVAARLYHRFQPFAAVAESAYRWVARHRGRLP